MAKTEAQKQAQIRYVESHPEVMLEISRRSEKRRAKRDRAEYMRAYRARKRKENPPV
jgi:hypothetical protein